MFQNSYYIIYKTTNIITNQIYVGLHKISNEAFDGYLGSGIYLKNSIKKYGKENFKRETLFICENEEEAFDIETLLVCKKFISRPDVMNLSIGGRGNITRGKFKRTEEQNEAFSIIMKNHYQYLKDNNIPNPNIGKKRTEEQKQKKRKPNLKLRGELNGMYGKSSNGMKGKKHTIESRELISKNKSENAGKYVRTEEHRKHTSNCNKGRTAHNKGIPTPETIKIKMRKPRKRSICPHCNKEGGGGNMIRYHFNNCKFKGITDV